MSVFNSVRVILDTNVWVSFLIGKRLLFLKELIASEQVLLVFSEELLQELKLVTERPKLRRYFPEERVQELFALLRLVGKVYSVSSSNKVSRDEKDNFLLDLAEAAHADYLVTGDKDLLVLDSFKGTKILTPADFEQVMVSVK